MDELQEGLGSWPISCEVVVQWGDMDAFNHVNHTVFLTWMETARMRYFSSCGLIELMDETGIGPILAGLRADYLHPVTFPDIITVHTTVTRIGASSFDMGYRVTSSARDGEAVATGTVFGVLYDYKSGKSVQIPEELKSRVLELESSSG
tara:strand:- start:5075 stop:5521 length:447 start_codon:yes stop_codon:yes gene_type:complete